MANEIERDTDLYDTFVREGADETLVPTYTAAAKTYSIESAAATALALDNAFSAVDQHGVAYDIKTNPASGTNVTIIKSSGDHTGATVTGSAGTTTNLMKITVAGTGGSAFGAGDVVKFELGDKSWKCTFSGTTAYTLAEDN